MKLKNTSFSKNSLVTSLLFFAATPLAILYAAHHVLASTPLYVLTIATSACVYLFYNGQASKTITERRRWKGFGHSSISEVKEPVHSALRLFIWYAYSHMIVYASHAFLIAQGMDEQSAYLVSFDSAGVLLALTYYMGPSLDRYLSKRSDFWSRWFPDEFVIEYPTEASHL